MPHRYQDLMVWQRGMDLAVNVYQFSRAFPKEEQYALTSQIRRAATSVPLNIAEGAGCRTDPEFAQFLGFAFRSCHEVSTAAELAVRLGYVSREDAERLKGPIEELTNMLFSFIRRLESK